MIICFEGPSAIGKTTLSEKLSGEFQIVPEVNQLFKNVDRNGKLWYYEKQLERYQISRNAKRPVILDGDVFQPIWYNWIYGFPVDFPSREETFDFYRNSITEGRIRFPNLYIVFESSTEELYKRKAADPTRQRRNFEKHLQMIKPQKAYFDFLKQHTPLAVKFVTYRSTEQARVDVVKLISDLEEKAWNDLACFEQIITWPGEVVKQ